MSEKRELSVKTASMVGVVGSGVNVGLEFVSTKYMGGRSALVDMPHQIGDVLAYGSVFLSRYWINAKKGLETASQWIISMGSITVGTAVLLETANDISLNGLYWQENSHWGEPLVLMGVLGINGIIHKAQTLSLSDDYDKGAHVNHVHAESEWKATAVLVAGSTASIVLGVPLLERGTAVMASYWVGYANFPDDSHKH